MVRIDLAEPYSVRFAREAIRDSLRAHGEECILMHTYHVNEDYETQPKCPVCHDEVYEQGERHDCSRCYGTGFDGGIKEVWRAWGQFSDTNDSEDIGKRGRWHPQERNFHTEYVPDLQQRDFVVRVSQWSADHRVLAIEGIYVLLQVQGESLRTGNQAGQTVLNNIGQRSSIQKLSSTMPIYRYNILGQQFPRFDGRER